MPYYSSKNIMLDTEKFEYFDQGGCANIYRNDDILLKIYNYECKYKHYLSKAMFRTIKNSDIPNMVKLLDYYHRHTGKVERLKPMDAYTMEMVKGNKVNLLEQKRDYLKDIIDQLEDTIERLVELKIVIEDPTSHNIIFTDNGVTIIDPDQFIRVPFFTNNFLYSCNKEKMITYLNKTIEDKRKTECVKHIYCGYNSSLTKDFNDFLTEETIEETIKKKVYKSI